MPAKDNRGRRHASKCGSNLQTHTHTLPCYCCCSSRKEKKRGPRKEGCQRNERPQADPLLAKAPAPEAAIKTIGSCICWTSLVRGWQPCHWRGCCGHRQRFKATLSSQQGFSVAPDFYASYQGFQGYMDLKGLKAIKPKKLSGDPENR